MSGAEQLLESWYNRAEVTLKNQLVVFIKELSKWLLLTFILIVSFVLGTGVFPINDFVVWFLFLVIWIVAVMLLIITVKVIKWKNSIEGVFREVLTHNKLEREKDREEVHVMRKEQVVLNGNITMLTDTNKELQEANLVLQSFTLDLVERFFINNEELKQADELIAIMKDMRKKIKNGYK